MNGKREKKENDILGAMTFEEIGRELGISGNGAWMLYKNALRKLDGYLERVGFWN
jgi:DNA-binding CsgD family transcriptional regulator